MSTAWPAGLLLGGPSGPFKWAWHSWAGIVQALWAIEVSNAVRIDSDAGGAACFLSPAGQSHWRRRAMRNDLEAGSAAWCLLCQKPHLAEWFDLLCLRRPPQFASVQSNDQSIVVHAWREFVLNWPCEAEIAPQPGNN